MPSRTGVIFATVTVAVVLAVMWSRRTIEPDPARPEAAADAGAPAAVRRADAPDAAAPKRGTTVYRARAAGGAAPDGTPAGAPGAREELDAGALAEPKVKLAEVKALRDKRERPGPRAKEELEILQYGLETIDEDIEACLASWKEAEPALTGKLMIAFRIDAGGLTEAWVAEHDDIPFGPRTCFANAVHGVDWSHIVDRPVELTQRYEIPGADAGTL